MGRTCGGEPAVRKGPWTLEEDLVLVGYISQHGEGSWDNLARAAGKPTSCCWINVDVEEDSRGLSLMSHL